MMELILYVSVFMGCSLASIYLGVRSLVFLIREMDHSHKSFGSFFPRLLISLVVIFAGSIAGHAYLSALMSGELYPDLVKSTKGSLGLYCLGFSYVVLWVSVYNHTRAPRSPKGTKQLTYIKCRGCGQDLCSNGSLVSDTYDSNGDNHVRYRCTLCKTEADYNFDVAPAPIHWDTLKGPSGFYDKDGVVRDLLLIQAKLVGHTGAPEVAEAFHGIDDLITNIRV